MKNERGITLSTLMIYIVAMAMVIITITNITRYFYANVAHTEETSKYAEEYLTFLKHITKEINEEDNTILQCKEDKENEGTENERITQKYVIFSKTYNQYTFKDGAIYKNQDKICENIRNCDFEKSEDGKLTVDITMEDNKQYTTTFNIRNY